MRLPIYESSPGAARALLATRQFAKIDLYTLQLVGGEVMNFSAGDVDVTFDGNTWTSHTVRFDDPTNKAVGNWKVGLDVATWQVYVYPRLVNPLTGDPYPDTIGGTPWMQAAANGALDGATIIINRAYFPGWPSPPVPVLTPTGVYRIFWGRTAEVEAVRGGIILNINSLMDLLNTQMPRDLYQALCFHKLFDPGCGLDANDFVQTGVVDTPPSTSLILNTAIGTPGGSGTFTLGRVVMTSGPNQGLQRGIKLWVPGTSFELMSPFFSIPQPGDTFNAFPGCDKTQESCVAFYGVTIDLTNFGGTPYVPQAETAV